MTKEPLILIIDDEAPIRDFLRAGLTARGYACEEASTADAGMTLAASLNPDLVLLDLGLPDQDGQRVVVALRERGYTQPQIAEKVDISESYVSMLLRLMSNGEERLIRGVEKGDIPMAVAVEIAAADEDGVQKSLREAYESGKLRGHALVKARRLVEQRRNRGKSLKRDKSGRGSAKRPISAEGIIRTYNKEVQRQALMVKKARLCETRLTFIQTALRDLFGDDNFINLLKAESLETAPKYIRDRVRAGKR